MKKSGMTIILVLLAMMLAVGCSKMPSANAENGSIADSSNAASSSQHETMPAALEIPRHTDLSAFAVGREQRQRAVR